MIFNVSKVPIQNRLLAVYSLFWDAQEISKTLEKEFQIELGGVSDEASFGKGFSDRIQDGFWLENDTPKHAQIASKIALKSDSPRVASGGNLILLQDAFKFDFRPFWERFRTPLGVILDSQVVPNS